MTKESRSTDSELLRPDMLHAPAGVVSVPLVASNAYGQKSSQPPSGTAAVSSGSCGSNLISLEGPLPKPNGVATGQQLFRRQGFTRYVRPVLAVRRGANVFPLPTAKRQISPEWKWKDLSMDVDRHMCNSAVSGVIVLKDGVVVLERYGLGRTHEDHWNGQSVTKSVTSILVGAAIQDGYISSVDAPVTDYVPELKDSAYDAVSVRHLLTMTAGVAETDDWSSPTSTANRAWSGPMVDGIDPTVAVMRGLPRVHSPGANFVYFTADADIAALMISNAVGRSVAEYLSDKLWRPFGMERDAFWSVNLALHERGGGDLQMTLRDFARIGQFMLRGGNVGGIQVLPRGWVSDATTAHVKFPEAATSRQLGYGYFWWITKDGYEAGGAYGQVIAIFPKDEIVIAINAAADYAIARSDDYGQRQTAFIEALRSAALRSH